MRALTLLCAVMAMLPAALPAGANDAANMPPLLRSDPFEGDAWAAYRIVVPAGGALVSIEALYGLENVRAASHGFWVMKDAGAALRLAFVATINSWGGREVAAQVLLPEARVHQGGGSFSIPQSPGVNMFLEAGEFVIVPIVAANRGEVLTGVFNLYGGAGVELRAARTGSDAALYRDADFDGVFNLFVNDGKGSLTKAALLGKVEERVEHRIFGLYQAITANGYATMAMDTPDGTLEGQTLYWLHGARAGDYTFRLDEMQDSRDGEGQLPAVWLLAADVALP